MTTATMIVTGLFFVHVLAWIALPGGKTEKRTHTAADELGRVEVGSLAEATS